MGDCEDLSWVWQAPTEGPWSRLAKGGWEKAKPDRLPIQAVTADVPL